MSLSLWANAWLAGHAAPDDVLDVLSSWAAVHSVTAYDAVAAGRTGLPWPDIEDAGTISLLHTIRTAADRMNQSAQTNPPLITVAMPIPGDVRGLPAGTQFHSDALTAGEAVMMSAGSGEAMGLIPEFEHDDDTDIDIHTGIEYLPQHYTLSWTVYSLSTEIVIDQYELGAAEYELRSAVRCATEALSALHQNSGLYRDGPLYRDDPVGADNPRALVEQIVESESYHRAPDHAPVRALRVLENAAYIDAIITVCDKLMPMSAHSSSEVALTSSTLRPLTTIVRSARLAAVNAILQSAWQN